LLLGSGWHERRGPRLARSRISILTPFAQQSPSIILSFASARLYLFLGPTWQPAAAAFFKFALFLFFYSKKVLLQFYMASIMHQRYCTLLSREKKRLLYGTENSEPYLLTQLPCGSRLHCARVNPSNQPSLPSGAESLHCTLCRVSSALWMT
jgi:hypothetical protein